MAGGPARYHERPGSWIDREAKEWKFPLHRILEDDIGKLEGIHQFSLGYESPPQSLAASEILNELFGSVIHVGDDSIYFDRYSKYKWVGAYEYWSRIYDLMNSKHLALEAAKKEARRQLTAEGQVFSPYHWEDWFEIKNQKGQDEMGEKYLYHDSVQKQTKCRTDQSQHYPVH